jgi:hypothetical protein
MLVVSGPPRCSNTGANSFERFVVVAPPPRVVGSLTQMLGRVVQTEANGDGAV